MQHGLAHRAAAVDLRIGEVEGELAAGELAGGQGTAYVQLLLAAEVGQLGGDAADRIVEVEGVGQVELTGHL